MLKFRIEQVALCPNDSDLARELLRDLGLTEWVRDMVVADGNVFGRPGRNEAFLQFNYESTGPEATRKPLELEILDYVEGPNWMMEAPNTVSHLGMHCSAAELAEFRTYFYSKGITVAQEVVTQSHTNPYINGKRRYNYVIFDTRELLGVDLKFIVRLNPDGTPYSGEV